MGRTSPPPSTTTSTPPTALALLHAWREAGRLDELRRGLDVFALGDLSLAPEPPPEALALRDERQLARDRRDFAEADRLREELERLGWRADDTAGGTVLFPLE